MPACAATAPKPPYVSATSRKAKTYKQPQGKCGAEYSTNINVVTPFRIESKKLNGITRDNIKHSTIEAFLRHFCACQETFLWYISTMACAMHAIYTYIWLG